ncbi:uncharacterized protein K489DRAFT_388350 [Dissoconium aciculare CBS 342.82]|uniref:Flavoprotein domain-containing protein n=1 Tax=Dissoconium aciculare CBS 342.82 TaxID=1314786 RepID=A0A6J3M6U2_9PEZI|nr:uncharacterized protein K489DRAFT_388350 [Dissoconium aciculare CBS 342.82]KAF1823608.1 hypothetical protein K489DRAFT_388350 [Dissoconium aciculare CBS 342.82]
MSVRRRQVPRDARRALQDTAHSHPGELNVIFASVGCNDARHTNVRHVADVEQEAAELCAWANILVLAPIDAYSLAKMLTGQTGNLLLELLRSWNVSRKVLMLPGMSQLMWRNPMTSKQMTEIRDNWDWVRTFKPILWEFDSFGTKKVTSWDSANELVEAVHNQVELLKLGEGLTVAPIPRAILPKPSTRPSNRLPPELWTIIFDMVGDWELAQNLHVYTNLKPPSDWYAHIRHKESEDRQLSDMETLEWIILCGTLCNVKQFVQDRGVPRILSRMCLTLMMRFAMTPLLAYLESVDHKILLCPPERSFFPDKASAVFGRVEILEFWCKSPTFADREYTEAAMDGASRMGFVHVLDWWRRSGLPLKYTEAALETASGNGHIAVLEWWKAQACIDSNSASGISELDRVDTTGRTSPTGLPLIRLKPGKSICFAAQNGHTEVVHWWLESGITFAHEDTVAKLASAHGHVAILELWYEMKGGKIIFDNSVLPLATKHGWIAVLEWWRRSGLTVEYRICDVEEALEDGFEGERGVEMRRWWAHNGLNLGSLGTSEWMKTKVL